MEMVCIPINFLWGGYTFQYSKFIDSYLMKFLTEIKGEIVHWIYSETSETLNN